MDHRNLKALMTKHKLTQQDMSEYLKIDASTFNFKINGKSDFTISEIEKIKSLFKKNYEEIFFNDEVRDRED